MTNDADYITTDDIPDILTIPTNVSAFTNDAGYLTHYTETDPEFNAWDMDYNDLTNKPTLFSGSYDDLTDKPTLFSGNYNDLTDKPTLFSGSYNDLTNKPTNADFGQALVRGTVNNPAGATDIAVTFNNYSLVSGGVVSIIFARNVPAGASLNINGQGSKPILWRGAALTDGVIKANDRCLFMYNSGADRYYLLAIDRWGVDINALAAVARTGSYNDLADIPEIPTIPTNVSAFTNDAGYVTSIEVQQAAGVPTVVSAFQNDAGYVTENQLNAAGYVTAEQIPTDVSAFNNDVGYITQADIPEIPTVPENVSVFNNDAQYVSNIECADVDLCTLAAELAQLQALVEEQQQRIEELEAQIGSPVVVDEKSCPGTPTVTDHEGNVYATVQIGNQCWMRDNLRTTTSPSTGTYIIPVAGASYTTSGKQARWYSDDSATFASMNFGLLYNWNAAVDTFNTDYGETSVITDESVGSVFAIFTGHRRGICPAGWHLPSDAEWTTLTNYVSSQSGYTCGGSSSNIAKALASKGEWNTSEASCVVGNDPSTNNATGFTAIPAGYHITMSFSGVRSNTSFWSSTQDNSSLALDRHLNYDLASVGRYYSHKRDYFSVRCLRDDGGVSVTKPTVNTGEVSEVLETTAVCGGEVTADGGAPVTARGVCWSTLQNPTVDDSHTVDGSGTGSFTSNITGLTAGTTYYVRAYATNSAGTAYGDEVSFITEATTPIVHGQPCPGTPTVTDHDGNVYATVQIGDQCWMKENLRTTHFADGTSIPAGGNIYSTTTSYYYDYSSSGIPLSERGYLYNWPAAMHGSASSSAIPSGVQGICPTGWHLPSDAEWTALTDYVGANYACGGDSYNTAKALASTTGWNTSTNNCATGNDQSANNASGFGVVPAGYWYNAGVEIGGAGDVAYFWSATLSSSSYVYDRYLSYSNTGVYQHSSTKGYGRSIRCLRD